jgi:hypothetical protein
VSSDDDDAATDVIPDQSCKPTPRKVIQCSSDDDAEETAPAKQTAPNIPAATPEKRGRDAATDTQVTAEARNIVLTLDPEPSPAKTPSKKPSPLKVRLVLHVECLLPEHRQLPLQCALRLVAISCLSNLT